MISIISGTNRRNSKTLAVANAVAESLSKKGLTNQLLDLNKVDFNLSNDLTYKGEQLPDHLIQLQDKFILNIQKFIIVSPEYNGSFPGVLKYFFDLISVREYKRSFSGKKFGLIGVASGRAGNLRGMDHLTGFLNHVGGIVMPGSQPMSSISGLLTEENELEEAGQEMINGFLDKFVSF